MRLTINGKELEFTFGMGFLGELLDETDLSLDEVLLKFDKNPFKFIPLCMYVSTKYAYELKGKKIDFDRHTLVKWIEADGGLTDDNKSVIEFTKAFSDSLFKNVPEEKTDGTSKKK
jgi:hypothetical protein